MKTRVILSILVLGGIILALFFGFQQSQQATPAGGTTVQLKAPEFVTAARAEGDAVASEISDLLDQEAGISAYYKSQTPITLSQVRSQFRTIEVENADYIIGSVAVPNYPEHFDVHVYVNKNGWILAYYLRQDPVSKIVDVIAQTIDTTKLKSVVSIVASAAGVPVTDVSYYDFRYPSANKMLFVSENDTNGNTFTIKTPATNSYSERSWTSINWPYTFSVDGQNRPNTLYGATEIYYGTLTASQLLPDVTHNVIVGQYGVLVIVYQEF